MSSTAEPTKALLTGRRALESVVGCQIVRDLRWFGRLWALHLRLTPPRLPPTAHVPSSTDWFLTVEEDYPSGIIGLYPAEEGGLTTTFWHQRSNIEGTGNEPWRRGNICTESLGCRLHRLGLEQEPRDPQERIRWHVRRAMAWLEAAAKGELIHKGDFFELPDYSPEGSLVIGFAESSEDFEIRPKARAGLVELVRHPRNKDLLVARRFTTCSGKLLEELPWGTEISQAVEVETALWLLLNEAPALPPWQAPTTWSELRTAAKSAGVDLVSLLARIPPQFRNGQSHILLMGFPISRRFGEEPERMHWLAVQLPVLSRGIQTVPGFRGPHGGLQRRDLQVVFKSSPLKWIRTENWAEDEISVRGRFSPGLRRNSILLIGAGALGSAVAELLVRGGVSRITIMDSESLQPGNLVRHTLTMREIGTSKAQALAEWLNSLSPHARIEHVKENFPSKNHLSEARMDMVIDCTAEDDVLTRLSAFSWPGEMDFVSLSLGMYARRLFVFTARNTVFPHQLMLDELQPWLRKERTGYSVEDLPWEGIGCWHPIFPARVEDVRLFASLAVKRLEQWAEKPGEAKLTVFERDEEGNLVRQVANG